MNSLKKLDALAMFESATLPHTADLFRCAMALLGNSSEAEKAVEECLLKALAIGRSIWSRSKLPPGALQHPASDRIAPAAGFTRIFSRCKAISCERRSTERAAAYAGAGSSRRTPGRCARVYI
jgi:hypothetical protein